MNDKYVSEAEYGNGNGKVKRLKALEEGGLSGFSGLGDSTDTEPDVGLSAEGRE